MAVAIIFFLILAGKKKRSVGFAQNNLRGKRDWKE